MRFTTTLILAVLMMAGFACKQDSGARQPISSNSNSISSAITNTAAATSVQHYVCPNNCAGSGGAEAGNCPVCGTAYLHNQAFHEQSTNSAIQNSPALQDQTTATAATTGAVQHYTCPNGCAGSGGAEAGNCPVCGTAYEHNQAFHNQPAANDPAQALQSPVFQDAPTAANSMAANTSGVKHYTCPNNCAGSGGDQAGSCPVCGTAYVHNAAYHNQPGAATQQQQSPVFQTQQSPVFKQSNTVVPNNTSPVNIPQGSGQFHYVCSNNCGGGAAATGNCPKCGSPLVHNAAYHNS